MNEITEAHRDAVREVVRAYEARWPDYAKAKGVHSPGRFSLDRLDEDGDAEFLDSGYYREDDVREYMPFQHILGTTEEMIENIELEKQQAAERKRAQEAAAGAARAEQLRRQREAAEREELRKREQIFREECKARGIEVPR